MALGGLDAAKGAEALVHAGKIPEPNGVVQRARQQPRAARVKCQRRHRLKTAIHVSDILEAKAMTQIDIYF